MFIAETDRLYISKYTTKDAAFFLELVNSPHWLKYIGDRNLKTEKEAQNYLKTKTIKGYDIFGFGFYKLTLKDENQTPIGTCGLIKRDTLDHIDIGFALLPEFEGKGFGFESSNAVLRLAKKTFNIKTIQAITLPTNNSSIKLLEKLGLSFQKRIQIPGDDEELLLYEKKINK